MGRIIWGSDKPYAKLINEGGPMKVFGRPVGYMTKRQFMGYSRIFDKRIEAIVEMEMKKAFR